MKFLFNLAILLCFIFVQSSVPEDEKAKILANHKDCLTKVGIDEEVLKKVKTGEFKELEKFREYIFCANKLNGFQDEKGNFQREKIVKFVNYTLENQEEAEKLYKLCSVEKEKPQNSAYEAFICYKKNSPKILTIL